jgi:hypothetical protein
MKNAVELLGHYGSDEVIACSAWTSTSRNLTDKKRNRIGNLINMLWRRQLDKQLYGQLHQQLKVEYENSK